MPVWLYRYSSTEQGKSLKEEPEHYWDQAGLPVAGFIYSIFGKGIYFLPGFSLLLSLFAFPVTHTVGHSRLLRGPTQPRHQKGFLPLSSAIRRRMSEKHTQITCWAAEETAIQWTPQPVPTDREGLSTTESLVSKWGDEVKCYSSPDKHLAPVPPGKINASLLLTCTDMMFSDTHI